MLGYSFGGQLCLEYALKYPEAVEKMVLQAPLLDDYDEVYKVQIEGFLKVTEGKMKEQISIISKSEISLKEIIKSGTLLILKLLIGYCLKIKSLQS